MDWLATLRRSGGINAIARHLGMSPADAGAGIAALLPMLIRGLRDYGAKAGGGEAGLIGLLALFREFGDGDLAADVMGPNRLDVSAGNRLLERLLGDGVEAATDEAERSTDVARDVLEELLPPLAMLVAGYIAARAAGSGAEGSGGLSGLDTLLVHDDDRPGSQRKGEGSRS